MLFNLLERLESVTESVPSSTGAGTPKNNTQQIIIWIILGVVLVGFIVMNYFSNKKRKAQMEAEKEFFICITKMVETIVTPSKEIG